MIRSHIKIAWRHLKKHKLFSLINVISLSVGITGAFLIWTYIQYELSYDTFHENKDRIVRLTQSFSPDAHTSTHFARCPEAWHPWVDALRADYPEIEKIARLTRRSGTVMELGDDRFTEDYFFITDRDVFNVFTIPLLQGDSKSALSNPYSVILAETTAQKYFQGDAVGKTLDVIDSQGNKIAYHITGIMKDWPANSHLQIHFLASNSGQNLENDWAYIYLLLHRDSDIHALEQKLPDFNRQQFGEHAAAHSAFYLQRLTDIHLRSHLDREIKVNGGIRSVHFLTIIAFFILLIACINSMNLTTAQSAGRTRETDIRRILGSSTGHLAGQFLTETWFITLFAGIFSLACIQLFLPVIINITGRDLTISWLDGRHIFRFLILLAGTWVLSGFYPTLLLARPLAFGRLQPYLPSSRFGNRPTLRNMLITIQFAITVFLLISAIILGNQLSYINHKSLGFNKEQVIRVGKNISQKTRAHYQSFRNRLMQRPGIADVAAVMEEPSYEVKDMGTSYVESVRTSDDPAILYILPVDEHFIDLMEINLLRGKNFSPRAQQPAPETFLNSDQFLEAVNNASRTYIINKTALHQIGFRSPDEAIGKQMDWHNAILDLQPGPIIGVVQDFHFSTLHKEVKPFVMVLEPRFLGSILVKIKPKNAAVTIGTIKNIWNDMFPEDPFEYRFLDDLFHALYAEEQQLNQIILGFSVIAILLGCLGLFGLVLHGTQQRTKEIGIRKTLGASVANIVAMLSSSYLRWVVLGNVVAWPFAWYAMHRWLQNFSYRIDLTIWPFLFSGAAALLVALLAVSWQTLRAATANPIDALRYE